MKNPLRTCSPGFWLLVGIISVASVVWALSIAHERKSRTSYQGKPLEYWFNQLPMTGISGVATVAQSSHGLLRSPSGVVKKYGDWLETPKASAKAIRSIGTNALIFYLRKLKRHDALMENKIYQLARSAGYRGFLWLEDIEPERGQAVTALILLKPLPTEVVSELVILSTNRNQQVAAAAQCALTTKENELVLLHPETGKHSIDADLLKIPISPDFW